MERHGAVDPGADFGGPTASQITPEPGWHLDRKLKLTAGHAMFQLRRAGDRRVFDEVRRSSEPVQIDPTFRGLVAIECCKGDVVHIGVNTETKN